MTELVALARLLKKPHPDWPDDLRFAGELALYTLQGMKRAAFKQSRALQDLAARTLGNFVRQYDEFSQQIIS